MHLSIKDLSYSINNKQILNNISVDVKRNEFVGIIGPNGSGKSTFLKNIYKVLKPNHGCIYINNKSIIDMSNKKLANEIAVVAQENSSSFDFSVKDIVLMGRYPKKSMFESSNKTDEALVKESLEQVGLVNFEDRKFNQLSGGEKQRVLIARAMVQETELIILDEPTNHLDIGYQIKTLKFLKNSKKTVFAALHDLNIAARYCDKIYVFFEGEVIGFGRPKDILNPELIKKLYDVDADILFNNENHLVIDYK